MTSKALVLSGGGPVGIAWETGVLAGLAQGGVDVGRADLIVGTSAGSVVGALLALGRTPAEMAANLRRQVAERAAQADAAQSVPVDLTPLLGLMEKMYSGTARQADVLREVAAFALAARTIDEETFIATFGRQIRESAWPAKRYMCTTLATDDGSLVVWDNDSGVPLARAVASSCSVPGVYPPVTINGRRYTDGPRSITSAQLACGHDRILIVLVRAGTFADLTTPIARAGQVQLEEELAAIHTAGGSARVIVPDDAALAVLGLNLMDFSRRAVALDAGIRQGRSAAAELAAFWS